MPKTFRALDFPAARSHRTTVRNPDAVMTEPDPVAAWRCKLVVDTDDPFYFDHPLDHVPGIMLITALLGLVRGTARRTPVRGPAASADAGEQGWTRTSLWFPRFCELDHDTELHACPSIRTANWTVIATQPFGPVCLGTFQHLDADPFAHRKQVPGYEQAPSLRAIPGRLVHRARPENILLGDVRQESSGPVRAAVLQPGSDDHLFAVRGGAARTAEELIEAARQATVMLWQYAHGWSADVKLTLNSVSAELPISIDRRIPLEVRWWPKPANGNKARTSFELVSRADRPELVGLITITSQAWSDSEWKRLRSGRK